MRRFLTHTTTRVVAAVALLTGIGYLIMLRDPHYHPSYEERSAAGASWAKDGFAVGVVWSHATDSGFLNGTTLAWEQVNAGGGPLAGKIRLRDFTDDGLGDGGEVAENVSSHPDIVAVIGEEVSSNAIPASLVYENHGILFLAPKSTDPRLTTHDFQYVFRLTPDDRAIAAALSSFAVEQHFKKVGVLYARTDQGESLAPRFLAAAKDAGVEIAFCRSYLPHGGNWRDEDFRPLIAQIREEQFDAIMIADDVPRAAKLVLDLARMGVSQPILASDKADSMMLWKIAGDAANNVYVASAVDPFSRSAEYLAFRKQYKKRYGIEPGYGASQGYDAFMLLVHAIAQSRTADPLVVSTTLRCTKEWKGLFGEYSFDNAGDVSGRPISVKRMFDGQFTTVTLFGGRHNDQS